MQRERQIKTKLDSLLKVARPERADDGTCMLKTAKCFHDQKVTMRSFLAGPN